MLTHVRVREEAKDCLDAPGLAYRRLPLLAPTIIIGNLNAAPIGNDRTCPSTATDVAVRDAMQQLGLIDLTAGLTGTPSHYSHQAGINPSRIDKCCRGPNHGARPRGNLRGPPTRRHRPQTAIHRHQQLYSGTYGKLGV